MEQAFQILVHLDEGPEVRGLGDGTSDDGSDNIGLGDEADPWILFHLFETKSNSFSLLIHLENHRMNFFTLFDFFRRMNDLASPRHIADMQ